MVIPACARFAVGKLQFPYQSGMVRVDCWLLLPRLLLPGVGCVVAKPVVSQRVVVRVALGKLSVVWTVVSLALVISCSACSVVARPLVVLVCHLGSRWALVI